MEKSHCCADTRGCVRNSHGASDEHDWVILINPRCAIRYDVAAAPRAVKRIAESRQVESTNAIYSFEHQVARNTHTHIQDELPS